MKKEKLEITWFHHKEIPEEIPKSCVHCQLDDQIDEAEDYGLEIFVWDLWKSYALQGYLCPECEKGIKEGELEELSEVEKEQIGKLIVLDYYYDSWRILREPTDKDLFGLIGKRKPLDESE